MAEVVESKDNKQRNSSIELLRIISMLMVLCLHANKDMILINSFSKLKINTLLLYSIESLSIVAVNCFVLISGYFLITSKSLQLRKVLDLIVLTSSYGLVLYIVSCLCGIDSLGVKQLIKCVFPYFFDKVWFVNVYLVLYLLHPFINRALNSLSKQNYKFLLGILLILFSLWPSFVPNPPCTDGGYGIISFVLIYCIAGYIRLHLELKITPIRYFVFYLFVSSITAILFVTKIIPGSWLNYNSIFVVIASVLLFLVFLSMKLYSIIINYVSLSMIAVLIIHTHQSIRPHLFLDLFKIHMKLESPFFILYYIIMILLIFIVCVIIDFLRRHLFRYSVDRILNYISVVNYKVKI